MTIQYYAINRDYTFDLGYKLIPAAHGIIRCILKAEYYCNRESAKDNGFKDAWKFIKDSGWNVNYLKSEIKAIYDDVAQNTFFIDKNDVDFKKHTIAIL